jgi:hypothetical protein
MRKYRNLPNWQKKMFNTYYIASDRPFKDSPYYDIRALVSRREGEYNNHEDIHARLIKNYTEIFAACVNKSDPYLAVNHWDSLIAICHIQNQALEAEAYELCHNCQLIINDVLALREYASFLSLLGIVGVPPSNLEYYLSKLA